MPTKRRKVGSFRCAMPAISSLESPPSDFLDGFRRGILRSSPRPGSEKFFGGGSGRSSSSRPSSIPSGPAARISALLGAGLFRAPLRSRTVKMARKVHGRGPCLLGESAARRRAGGTRRGRRPVSAPAFFAHRPCVLRCGPRYGSRSCELRFDAVLRSS